VKPAGETEKKDLTNISLSDNNVINNGINNGINNMNSTDNTVVVDGEKMMVFQDLIAEFGKAGNDVVNGILEGDTDEIKAKAIAQVIQNNLTKGKEYNDDFPVKLNQYAQENQNFTKLLIEKLNKKSLEYSEKKDEFHKKSAEEIGKLILELKKQLPAEDKEFEKKTLSEVSDNIEALNYQKRLLASEKQEQEKKPIIEKISQLEEIVKSSSSPENLKAMLIKAINAAELGKDPLQGVTRKLREEIINLALEEGVLTKEQLEKFKNSNPSYNVLSNNMHQEKNTTLDEIDITHQEDPPSQNELVENARVKALEWIVKDDRNLVKALKELEERKINNVVSDENDHLSMEDYAKELSLERQHNDIDFNSRAISEEKAYLNELMQQTDEARRMIESEGPKRFKKALDFKFANEDLNTNFTAKLLRGALEANYTKILQQRKDLEIENLTEKKLNADLSNLKDGYKRDQFEYNKNGMAGTKILGLVLIGLLFPIGTIFSLISTLVHKMNRSRAKNDMDKKYKLEKGIIEEKQRKNKKNIAMLTTEVDNVEAQVENNNQTVDKFGKLNDARRKSTAKNLNTDKKEYDDLLAQLPNKSLQALIKAKTDAVSSEVTSAPKTGLSTKVFSTRKTNKMG
jgi:hypothetical protein